MNDVSNEAKVVFWHRELPPMDGESMAEHVVEAARRSAELADQFGGR